MGNTGRQQAEEKGYNIYRRANDPLCAKADAWWKNHAAFWVVVRQVWENTLHESGDIFRMKTTVDGERLYEKLGKVEDAKIPADKLTDAITKTLRTYTEH